MKKIRIHIIILLASWLCLSNTYAAQFSYVYIQGDKQTPFYVKLEEDMLPRYGKNYCIIPELAPGIIHIQVLFQQNLYPAQNYTIVVPENGTRGFLLMKKNDEYSLYDIQQQFYLLPGNKAEDDHAPENTNSYIGTVGPASEATVQTTKTTTNTTTTNPDFLDIELKNNRTAQDNSTIPVGNVAIRNKSNCTKAVDREVFDAIYKKASDKREDSRLKYLMNKIDENCFNTTQVTTLTKILPNDPERYTFLKQVYPKTTDQYQFPALEALLSTEEWKGYFKLIIQP